MNNIKVKENLISGSVKVSASDNILFQEIDKELVILNVKDEQYLGLDETGTIFWKKMIESKSLQGAFNDLLNEFNVDPAILLKDLNELLYELKQYGLIDISQLNDK